MHVLLRTLAVLQPLLDSGPASVLGESAISCRSYIMDRRQREFRALLTEIGFRPAL
jgi:hypothetical protein